MDHLLDGLFTLVLLAAWFGGACLVAMGAVAMFATAYTYFTGKELLP